MSLSKSNTGVRIMAILALFGILFSIIGTAWITNVPPPESPVISGEVTK